MDPKRTKEFRRRLSNEREKMMDSIGRSRSAENEIVGAGKTEDEGDMATLSQEKDILFSLNESAFARLRFIQAAVDALDRGNYGECRRCAREIGEKRLMAVPWAMTCILCQEATEAEHISARVTPSGIGPTDEL